MSVVPEGPPPAGDCLPIGHVFLSHATADAASVAGMAKELEARDWRCWISSRDIPIGANYAVEITEGMKDSVACVVLLSRAALDSPHVRREVNLAIELRKPLLPLSLEAGIRSAADLPGDWAYWLSLVQIQEFIDARHGAALVAASLTRGGENVAAGGAPAQAPAGAATSDAPRPAPDAGPAPRTCARTSISRDDRLRSTLIQVAAAGLAFRIAVERGRRLGASPDDVEAVAYRLREGQLLAFEDHLGPATIIRLT